jgi:transaldolase
MGDIGLLAGEAAAAKHNYGFSSQILGGSVKTQDQVGTCIRAGLDIVTLPEPVFFQMFNHPLTDQGLGEFDAVWKQVREK